MDLLGESTRDGPPDPVDPHGRVGAGVAEPAGEGDEPGAVRAVRSVADRLRFPAVDPELGLAEHPGVGVEDPLYAGGSQLAVRVGQRAGRSQDDSHEFVQQRLQVLVGHEELLIGGGTRCLDRSSREVQSAKHSSNLNDPMMPYFDWIVQEGR